MPGFTNQFIEDLMYKISTRPSHFKGVHPSDIFLDKVDKEELLLKEKNSPTKSTMIVFMVTKPGTAVLNI